MMKLEEMERAEARGAAMERARIRRELVDASSEDGRSTIFETLRAAAEDILDGPARATLCDVVDFLEQPVNPSSERGADGIIETTAGPDDLEAHEELLRVVAERDRLRGEKAEALQVARKARLLVIEWRREARRRQRAHLETRKKLRKLRKAASATL